SLCRLALTPAALRHLVHAPADGPGRFVLCPAGLNRLPGRMEWLVHRTHRPTGGFPPAIAVVVLTRRTGRLGPALHEALLLGPATAPSAALALGVGPAAGLLAGLCRVEGTVVPLAGVAIAGPGLPAVELAPPPAREAAPSDPL